MNVGPNVKVIAPNAFNGADKLTVIKVKSKKLVAKYKGCFSRKNAGRKAKVTKK